MQGLRHLQYSPLGFGQAPDNAAWNVYSNFVQAEISGTGYDRQAYHVFSKQLPNEHGTLLTVCLDLFAGVAAHDAQNAMPGMCPLLLT